MLRPLRDWERSLTFDRLRIAFALAVTIAAALTLASCGRAGPPEAPSGPLLGAAPAAETIPPGAAPPAAGGPAPMAQTAGAKTGFDANGNPVAPPGQKKSFLLDPLLQ
jgi:hypothetical protein